MSDNTLLAVTPMPKKRQRIRQLKYHLNQIISELRTLQPIDYIKQLEITIHSEVTTISTHEENFCPYLLCKKQKAGVLHSTTNNQYRKKSKKFLFAASACATSTPKSSPIQNKVLLKPYHTSTPRHQQRHSTALDIQQNNNIPLKCLLYNKDFVKRHQNKRRHSAVPYSKRSILPRLHLIQENAQWI
jgi:hypothetical protein